MTSAGTHLTETEFVDLFDGTLPAARRQHLEGCDACAAQAAELVSSAGDAAQADVPEPPPFFWTQFSARVSERVANEAATPRIAALAWLRAPWMGAAAAVCVVILLTVFVARRPSETPPASTSTAVESAVAAHPDAVAGDDMADLDSDEAWAVVRALAEDMDEHQFDDQGVSAAAGAAEHMTQQLSDAERIELARLIQEQLRLAGAAESAS